jgi:hypothetical protein
VVGQCARRPTDQVRGEKDRRARGVEGLRRLRARPTTKAVMTRILHTYPIITFYSILSSLRACTANPFSRFFSIALLRRPTGVSPTGSLAPFPFVSALFVLTCAIEGQLSLPAAAAHLAWLRDACAKRSVYSLHSYTHSLFLRALSNRRTLRTSFPSSHKSDPQPPADIVKRPRRGARPTGARPGMSTEQHALAWEK